MSLTSQLHVFETLRTYRGKIRAFKQHMKRLFNSWSLLYQDQILESEQLHEQFTAIEKQILEICASRHLSHEQFETRFDQAPDEYVIRVYLNRTLKVEVRFTPLDRSYINHPMSIKHANLKPVYPPAAKHSDREAWLEACHQLRCDEIILCSPQGLALETNNSNLWALELKCEMTELREQLTSKMTQPLKKTKWYTPSTDGQILPGITRSLLIGILKDLGAEVDDQAILSMKDHSNLIKHIENHTRVPQVSLLATKAYIYFLSSTLKSLSWVQKIDDKEQTRPPFLSELYSLIENQLSRC